LVLAIGPWKASILVSAPKNPYRSTSSEGYPYMSTVFTCVLCFWKTNHINLKSCGFCTTSQDF